MNVKFQFLHKNDTLQFQKKPHIKFLSKIITPEIFPYLFIRILLFVCLIILFSLFFLNGVKTASSTKDTLQEDIASQIIRFHVIANSDTSEDQAVKLKVKSALTDAFRLKLEKAKNISEAREILTNNLDQMEEIANQVIKEDGFTYQAKASMEKGYFPLKVYGDLTLPPGEYEAVRIEIGKAKGQNWWCIMFPPLCFVDATYSIVPKDSKEKLKEVLTKEEYDEVFSNKEPEIKIKFKLLSIIEDYLKN